MKDDKTFPRLAFLQDPDEYKRVAEGQRTWVRKIADKLDCPQSLTLEPMEREFVAGLLRHWADNLSDAPKGRQGPASKFDPAGEALVYAAGRISGKRHGEVVDEMSDRLEVSRPAVEKGISKWRVQAFALLGKPDPDNQ